ncbi:hypothetical protein V8E36_001984 [Tilletia maclaganii]
MFRVTTREYKNYTYTDTATGQPTQRSISLDVYLPDGIECWRNPLLRFSEIHTQKKPPLSGFGGLVERDRVAQLVVWIHPGGFLTGTRKYIPPHLQRAVENHRLVVVIPDYRLCPQVTMVESLCDIRDACEYAIGGALGEQVNTSTWALGGSSAGGWASLLLGLGLTVPNTLGSAPAAPPELSPVSDLLTDAGLGFPSTASPPRRRKNLSSGSTSGAGASLAGSGGDSLAGPSGSLPRGSKTSSDSTALGPDGEPLLPTLSRLPRAVFALYPVTDITREGGAAYYEPLRPITWKPAVQTGIGADGIIDGAVVEPFLVKPGQEPVASTSSSSASASAPAASEEYADASAVVSASDPQNDPIRSQLFNYARQEGIFPSLILPSNLSPERVSLPSLLRTAAGITGSASPSGAGSSSTGSSDAASAAALPSAIAMTASTSTSSSTNLSLSRSLNLPPTFIAWGDADERVPPSQSTDVVKALNEAGAEVRTYVAEGKEHLFDFEEDAEVPGLWRWTIEKLGGL